MKAELIKDGNLYILKDGDRFIGTSDYELNRLVNYPFKLSLKNCEAIANGYDLDELAVKEYLDGYDTTEMCKAAFKDDFQKALELNKDMQFTVEQMKKAIDKAKQGSVKWVEIYEGDSELPRFVLDDLSYDEIIKPLQQQTQIEVEIVQEQGKDTFGNAELTWYNPKLDADGCIILKRAE